MFVISISSILFLRGWLIAFNNWAINHFGGCRDCAWFVLMQALVKATSISKNSLAVSWIGLVPACVTTSSNCLSKYATGSGGPRVANTQSLMAGYVYVAEDGRSTMYCCPLIPIVAANRREVSWSATPCAFAAASNCRNQYSNFSDWLTSSYVTPFRALTDGIGAFIVGGGMGCSGRLASACCTRLCISASMFVSVVYVWDLV